jgi:hypothetical protein
MEGWRIMAFNLDDYTTVQERSNIFWERYPNGAVRTRIVSESDTRVIVVCELFRDNSDEKPFATGEAKEVISDRGVNRDFALENCATSARGVAFKVANIGTEKNGPSREEMQRVNEKQFTPKYGRPGSKSAAMEMALHLVDSQSKDTGNEPVPIEWSVGESITQIGEVVSVGFTCRHGSMVKKEGIAKGTNKPYAGYVCSAAKPDQCDAKWAKLTAAGTWYWPDDSELGKGGE